MDYSTPGFPVLHYLLQFAQTHVHWVGNAIQRSHPVTLFSSCPQSFPASGSFPMSWLFTSGGQSDGIRWNFSFSIRPSNEYSGLISFRMDWFDLLAVQGTLKSLLQHHSLKASILQRSAFLMVQLLHPYMSTGVLLWEEAKLWLKKEGWTLKNWCVRIVLQKTLESPLDSKEVKPVSPKGH